MIPKFIWPPSSLGQTYLTTSLIPQNALQEMLPKAFHRILKPKCFRAKVNPMTPWELDLGWNLQPWSSHLVRFPGLGPRSDDGLTWRAKPRMTRRRWGKSIPSLTERHWDISQTALFSLTLIIPIFWSPGEGEIRYVFGFHFVFSLRCHAALSWVTHFCYSHSSLSKCKRTSLKMLNTYTHYSETIQ